MATNWTLLLIVGCIFLLESEIEAQATEVRLVNGTTTRGRVEVLRPGDAVWGTICDDYWSNEDAAVVCKMLGQILGGTAMTRAYFGQGTGPIIWTGLGCSGSENNIEDCPRGGSTSGCSHIEDAGVICNTAADAVTTPSTTPKPPVQQPSNCGTSVPESTEVRIIGFDKGSGIVELSYEGTWGTLCDDNWNLNDARTVCRILCFGIGENALPGAVGNHVASSPMILDSLGCSGTENFIANCSSSRWNESTCAKTEPALVTCVHPDSSQPLAPVAELRCDNGQISAGFQAVDNLEEKHLTVGKPISGVACDVQKSSDAGLIWIHIPFNQCTTNSTNTATHITYTNVVDYTIALTQSESDPITRYNTYHITVSCVLPRAYTAVDPGIQPLTEAATQTAAGEFKVDMKFYMNNSFTEAITQFPIRIPLGAYMNVGLSLQDINSNVKLIVPNCRATPFANMSMAIKYDLITDKCADDSTVAMYSINSTSFNFRFQTFKFFGNYSSVYLQCDAFVCKLEEKDARCDRSCNSTATTSGRKRRSFRFNHQVYSVNSGLILLYDPHENNIENGNQQIEKPTEGKKYRFLTVKDLIGDPVSTASQVYKMSLYSIIYLNIILFNIFGLL